MGDKLESPCGRGARLERQLSHHDTRMTMHHIREWRKARGLTQARLAEAVDLTETSINRIENGKQRLTETNLAARAHPIDGAG